MTEIKPAINVVRSRYLLLILMLIPIAVVLMASFVFFTGIGMPEGTRNKGVLIIPPQQINDIDLLNQQGTKQKVEWIKESDWTFLIAHPANCDESCREKFWENRQTRVALGKYQGHIRRVWLVTEGRIDEQTQEWLLREHKDMQLLFVNGEAWQKLLQQSVVDQNAAQFYLLDPRGFVMMYYTKEQTYKDVIVDMKFLLKGVE
ncbi:MAG TPA: hypothetical protein PK031_03795 [Pseudomonadales bacterium]|nr:hypothetical protein [Pseudomonadales bacterium]